MQIEDEIRGHLAAVRILPERLILQTEGVEATVPMLRGVWGAALHEVDARAYREVFAPDGQSGGSPPLYLLRPARPTAEGPAVDFFLFGRAIPLEAVLLKAWSVACRRGLGPARTPFRVLRVETLDPQGQPQKDGANAAWTLDAAVDAFARAGLTSGACQLRFVTPVRLIRDNRLVERPTLADVIVAAHRRVAALLPEPRQAAWQALRGSLLELARRTPSTWQGERLDLERYSGRQRQGLVLRGMIGTLDLDEGPGALAPLLAVLPWLHVGKGTVMGLGGAAFGRAARNRPSDARSPALGPRRAPAAVFYSIGVARPIAPTEPLPPCPPIPPGSLVVIEGRAPIWRYAMALCRLQGSPAAAVAVWDPRLGAVVVTSQSPTFEPGQVIDLRLPDESNRRL